MEHKMRILLVVLAALQSVCAQTTVNSNPSQTVPITPGSTNLARPSGEVVPQGKASLSFVIDVSGSMGSDIAQVRTSVASIINAATAGPDILHDFILSVFNDPGVGPVYLTRNLATYQTYINGLSPSGGGDCPEKAGEGIKLALQASTKYSYIFVFTDASAKDYSLLPEILNLIAAKGSTVTFLLTGSCGSTTHPGYTFYSSIAAASSGQVYDISKGDVTKILNYIAAIFSSPSVYLCYGYSYTAVSQSYTVTVDASITAIFVSVSGSSVGLSIFSPGSSSAVSTGIVKVVDLGNTKVYRINSPASGTWRVQASSSSKYTVQVTGFSNVTFTYSIHTSVSLTTTGSAVAGTLRYIKISGVNLDATSSFSKIELVNASGNAVLATASLRGTSRPHYYAALTIPNQAFYIRVTGRIRSTVCIRWSQSIINIISPPNHCASGPCLNGGRCSNEVTSYQCLCQRGYTGRRCETALNPCISVTCQHGGSCRAVGTSSFACDCINGYTGTYCQTAPPNPCTRVACQNGGTCRRVSLNNYRCDCPASYTGRHCETPTGPLRYNCESRPKRSPCGPPVLSPGIYYYPHDNDDMFVQCDAWGGCFNMPCAPGTEWSQAAFTCVHATG